MGDGISCAVLKKFHTPIKTKTSNFTASPDTQRVVHIIPLVDEWGWSVSKVTSVFNLQQTRDTISHKVYSSQKTNTYYSNDIGRFIPD